MSSNSTYDFIDHETFTISNSTWVPLNKSELMELPWIREIVTHPGTELYINYIWGCTVLRISDGGAIIPTEDDKERIYILKNITKPSRLRIEQYITKEGFVDRFPIDFMNISWVGTSLEYIDPKSGLKIHYVNPITYSYDKQGKLSSEGWDDDY
jgi:hypothetical protein